MSQLTPIFIGVFYIIAYYFDFVNCVFYHFLFVKKSNFASCKYYPKYVFEKSNTSFSIAKFDLFSRFLPHFCPSEKNFKNFLKCVRVQIV